MLKMLNGNVRPAPQKKDLANVKNVVMSLLEGKINRVAATKEIFSVTIAGTSNVARIGHNNKIGIHSNRNAGISVINGTSAINAAIGTNAVTNDRAANAISGILVAIGISGINVMIGINSGTSATIAATEINGGASNRTGPINSGRTGHSNGNRSTSKPLLKQRAFWN